MCSRYYESSNYIKCCIEYSEVQVDNTGFIQFVFDNVDVNFCTLDGQGTFHALGGIKCITPSSSVAIKKEIPRVKISQNDAEPHKIPEIEYREPTVSGFKNIVFKAVGISHVRKHFAVDVLWLTGFNNFDSNP